MAPGGYTVLHGNRYRGHGVAGGPYLKPEDFAKAKARSRDKRRQELHDAMTPDEDEESTEEARGTQVRQSPRVIKDRRSSPSTKPTSRKGDQWLGLSSPRGRRVIVSSPRDLEEWTEVGYEHVRTFQDQQEAKAWVKRGNSRDATPPSDKSPRRSKAGHTPHRSGPDESESEDDDSIPPLTDRSPRRDHARQRHGAYKDSDPSEDDSSSDSESEESSSESDDSYRVSRSRDKRHRQQRKRRHKRRNRSISLDEDRDRRDRHHLPKGKSLIGGDSSTGEEEVYGMDVDSDKLMASLGPPDMTRKMSRTLFDFPTDVLSLPGGWSTTTGEDGTYGEDQLVSQVNAILRTTTDGRDKEHDPGWKSPNHHALGKVNSAQKLAALIDGYQKTINRATKFENQRLKQWMTRFRYSAKDFTRYKERGGLPILLRELQGLYFNLLMKLQSETNKVAPLWTGTYAEGLLLYHSRELAYVRSMAGSRQDLILTNYIYLRNAAKSKWTNLEVSDAMIKDRLNALSPTPAGNDSAGAPGRKACRCQNAKLHKLLSLRYYEAPADVCPVATAVSAPKARTAAKLLLTKVESHDGVPPKPTWMGWAAKAVAAATEGRTSI